MTPPNKLEETLSQVVKILRSRGCRRVPIGFSAPFIANSPLPARILCLSSLWRPPSKFHKSMRRKSQIILRALLSGLMLSNRICPIFQVSNVTGTGLDFVCVFD